MPMTLRLATRLSALALTVGLAGQASAAQAPRPPGIVTGDLARRDIRVPDSVPNISGTWMAASSNRTTRPVDDSATPFLPWARAFFEERAAGETAGRPLFDPNANCFPSGVPRTIPSPYPVDIVQTPDKIIISIEPMHTFRVIHMDGKPMPAGYSAFFGYSVGKWEGDTLVIETTGINGYPFVDVEGRPKSNQIKVVEHIRKVSPNFLENTFTIYDSITYSRPWTARALRTWTSDYRMTEYICEENNRNASDETGRIRTN